MVLSGKKGKNTVTSYKYTKQGILDILDGKTEWPNVFFGDVINSDETHAVDRGKTIHNLHTFEREIFRDTEISAIAKYNMCPACKEVRNKFVAVFFKNENLCRVKWFVKHGRNYSE